MVLVMKAHGKELVSLKGVKWVFFDVGGALVDSGPLFSYIAENLYPTLHVDVEFLRERIIRHFARLKSEGRFKSGRRLKTSKLHLHTFRQEGKELAKKCLPQRGYNCQQLIRSCKIILRTHMAKARTLVFYSIDG